MDNVVAVVNNVILLNVNNTDWHSKVQSNLSNEEVNDGVSTDIADHPTLNGT